MRILLILTLLSLAFISCTEEKLKYYGRHEVNPETTDTIYHSVQPFSFINQDNEEVTEDYLKDKITIVDFFFSTCPTICPVMTNNMVKLQKKWGVQPEVQFLSHTVDPETDTPAKLKRYAKWKHANTSNWNFVTGDKRKIYESGVFSFMVATQEDALSEHGFLHSSLFIMVDKDLRIRGIYNGLEDQDLNKLSKDINILLNEYR
ncbi:MAG: SCO family protein [Flavobacteriales bacterium]